MNYNRPGTNWWDNLRTEPYRTSKAIRKKPANQPADSTVRYQMEKHGETKTEKLATHRLAKRFLSGIRRAGAHKARLV